MGWSERPDMDDGIRLKGLDPIFIKDFDIENTDDGIDIHGINAVIENITITSDNDWGYEPEEDELTEEEHRMFARNTWLALAGSALTVALYLLLR